MYVTAQRVRSRTREGINAFFNLHPPVDENDIEWESPSIEHVVEAEPGVLLGQDCDLRPGGNRVRSFLDVVTANATELPRIRQALHEFRRQLGTAPLPRMEIIDHVAIRFDAERALHDEQVDEYGVLEARVLRLVERFLTRQAPPPLGSLLHDRSPA